MRGSAERLGGGRVHVVVLDRIEEQAGGQRGERESRAAGRFGESLGAAALRAGDLRDDTAHPRTAQRPALGEDVGDRVGVHGVAAPSAGRR